MWAPLWGLGRGGLTFASLHRHLHPPSQCSIAGPVLCTHIQLAIHLALHLVLHLVLHQLHLLLIHTSSSFIHKHDRKEKNQGTEAKLDAQVVSSSKQGVYGVNEAAYYMREGVLK